MTYRELINIYTKKAVELGKEESATVILLEFASKLSPSELYSKLKEEVEEEVLNKFYSCIDEYYTKNRPVQYIVGTANFYGYDFIVNENVLIPRCETEELVENILYRYDKYFKGQKVSVCDIATGSGCIGITLALEEKNMDVTITDISQDALNVARANCKKLGANVNILCGDMLEPLKGKKFDILVSNPPYIPESEEVMPLVKDNEPNIALFGGKDGMKFYNIILSKCREILNDKALIGFEHGFDKKEEMILLAKKYFPFAHIEVIKDLEKKDRMTFIYIERKN